MRNLIHPNVVEIMGACVYPVYAIAMEYMACGSLDQCKLQIIFSFFNEHPFILVRCMPNLSSRYIC